MFADLSNGMDFGMQYANFEHVWHNNNDASQRWLIVFGRGRFTIPTHASPWYNEGCMLPLADSTPTRTIPFVNYLIIGLNIIVFFVQLSATNLNQFVMQYGFIPAEFNPFNLLAYESVFAAMFMHGGIMHIASNLWFLHIFGDNVEDAIGHIPYLLFYLVVGVAATFAQYILNVDSSIPMIGASGAISGVAGAYFVLYRHSSVKTLIYTLFGIEIVRLPVSIFLGYWFLIQVFSGVGSLVTLEINQGGVAWFAHIGGFVAGFLLIRMLKTDDGSSSTHSRYVDERHSYTS